MDVVKWDPFREMEDVVDRFSRLLGHRSLLSPRFGRELVAAADWVPAVDIKETESEYLIKAELPEVKKGDVKISVEGDILTVKGERKEEKEEKTKKIHRLERSYGSFTRSFALPDNVDSAKITAEHKDGMLYMHLPKTEQVKSKAVDIPVK
jgi:HSP20 family protein